MKSQGFEFAGDAVELGGFWLCLWSWRSLAHRGRSELEGFEGSVTG